MNINLMRTRPITAERLAELQEKSANPPEGRMGWIRLQTCDVCQEEFTEWETLKLGRHLIEVCEDCFSEYFNRDRWEQDLVKSVIGIWTTGHRPETADDPDAKNADKISCK